MLETGDMMSDYKLLETDSPYGYITIKEKNLNSHPIRILDWRLENELQGNGAAHHMERV